MREDSSLLFRSFCKAWRFDLCDGEEEVEESVRAEVGICCPSPIIDLLSLLGFLILASSSRSFRSNCWFSSSLKRERGVKICNVAVRLLRYNPPLLQFSINFGFCIHLS